MIAVERGPRTAARRCCSSCSARPRRRLAQDTEPPSAAPADAPPPVATEAAAPQGARTYTPADFARFAPRNALDMLNNVPGFAIDESDTERRGLGQATGNVLINGERFSGKSTDIFTELGRISASQRRPDRDRRRRHAQHFRPHRPGRQRHHPVARPFRQFRLAAADPGAAHAGAAARRRGLDQRLARRHPIYAEPAQRQPAQRQCRAGAGDHAARHDPRPARRGAVRRRGRAAPVGIDPPHLRRRLDPQRQCRLRPFQPRPRREFAALGSGPAGPRPHPARARARI